MILVTGGTGFVGQALVRHLVEDGRKVRTLVRPSKKTPELPTGVPVEIAISNIFDERNLQSALVGVDTIYHLVGGEWLGVSADLNQIELAGIRTLLEAAQEVGVKRIFYLSHIGADRASAYPVLKIKGIVEEFIKKSGIDFTILRTGLVFGPSDHFTTDLAKLISIAPYYVPLPGKGDAMIQPIWVEDLVTCLSWALEDEKTIGQTYTIGGPEFLTIKGVFEAVIEAIGVRRGFLNLQPSYMRIAAVLAEYFFPALPHSVYWLDYLAANRTTEIDAVTRYFGLLPARFSQHLGHLKGINWRSEVLFSRFRRSAQK